MASTTVANPLNVSVGVEEDKPKQATSKSSTKCSPLCVLLPILVVCLIGGAFVGGYFVGTAAPASTSDDHGDYVHWSYSGAGAAQYWGSINNAEYALCSTGSQQSPINIITADATVISGNNPLQRNYSSWVNNAMLDARSNHPGFKVVPKTPEPSNRGLLVDGVLYQLVQFHFHSPSEHVVNGVIYPLEMHMVHVAANGNVAVVGYLFKESSSNNAFLASFWGEMQKNYDPISVNLNDILPTMSSTYWRYDGSFTTPPCTQGVKWFVTESTATVSSQQVKEFVDFVHPNARPAQPLGSRTVDRYLI